MIRTSLQFLLLAVCLRVAQAQAQPTLAFHVVAPTSGENLFGSEFSRFPDLDGDGLADILVGSHLADPNGINSGAARVHSGSDGSIILDIAGGTANGFFGLSAAHGGDIDGDGVPDLIVGAPGEDGNGIGAGGVRAFSGSDGSVLLSLVGLAAGEQLGSDVAAISDVNGDGIPDLVVGASSADLGGADSGAARVYSGADGSILVAVAGAPGDFLGYAVAGLGDIDGDDVPDFLAGGPGTYWNGTRTGGAILVSGADGSLIRSHHGRAQDDFFGGDVAAAGDVTGDGVPDYVIAARRETMGFNHEGVVRVYSGADGSVVHTLSGYAGSFFGDSVDGGLDVDGDSVPDVIVGMAATYSSHVRVFSGADGSLLHDLTNGVNGSLFGYQTALLGDIDGDGFCDFGVGIYNDWPNPPNAKLSVYRVPTLPVLKRRSASGLAHLLDLSWLPAGGSASSVTGALVASGAPPGALGLAVTSLVGIDHPFAGYLPILVNPDPAFLIGYAGFGFDAAGQLLAPGISRQIPALAGYRIHVQLFALQPVIGSSPAIRLEVLP